MSDLPENWIDKIFDLLSQFYGERWRRQFNPELPVEMYKTMWFNGLCRLSYDQLRQGLAVCKRLSSYPSAKPPTVIIFYHFCVGTSFT